MDVFSKGYVKIADVHVFFSYLRFDLSASELLAHIDAADHLDLFVECRTSMRCARVSTPPCLSCCRMPIEVPIRK